MIFCIVIAAIIIAVVAAYIYTEELGAAVAGLLVSGFLGSAVLLISIGVSNSSGEDTYTSHDLKALVTDVETPGSYFFLGTGTVEDKPVYTYIMKTDDYYTIESTTQKNGRIVEIDSGQPYVEYHYMVLDNNWIVAPFPTPWPQYSYTKFYIPENSIYEGYSVTP